MCGDKLEYDTTYGRMYYKLLDTSSYHGCKNEIGGVAQDPRFYPIASVLEQQLFDENGVT